VVLISLLTAYYLLQKCNVSIKTHREKHKKERERRGEQVKVRLPSAFSVELLHTPQ
jgi:hypothetical protein